MYERCTYSVFVSILFCIGWWSFYFVDLTTWVLYLFSLNCTDCFNQSLFWYWTYAGVVITNCENNALWHETNSSCELWETFETKIVNCLTSYLSLSTFYFSITRHPKWWLARFNSYLIHNRGGIGVHIGDISEETYLWWVQVHEDWSH
jgi:hypothetical protein